MYPEASSLTASTRVRCTGWRSRRRKSRSARCAPSGQIGRAAVLRAYRGQGVGSRLLRHAIAAAEALGWDQVWVNAQHSRRGFYASHGFIVISDLFTDAGILHQRMLRPLNQMACALRDAS